MTKEEIISVNATSERRVSDFNQAPSYDFRYMTIPNATAAMDQFAKQQAIAFDVWKGHNGYTLNYPYNEYVKLVVSGNRAETFLVPTDEVYALFIEQQVK